MRIRDPVADLVGMALRHRFAGEDVIGLPHAVLPLPARSRPLRDARSCARAGMTRATGAATRRRRSALDKAPSLCRRSRTRGQDRSGRTGGRARLKSRLGEARRRGWRAPWPARTGACAPPDRRSGSRPAPAPGSRACRAAAPRRRARRRRRSSASPGTGVAAGGRAQRRRLRQVVEEERHRHVQDPAELEQPRRPDPVDAALVFLHLLEGQAEQLAQPLLAHAEQGAPQPQPLADMHIDRVGLARHAASRPARSEVGRRTAAADDRLGPARSEARCSAFCGFVNLSRAPAAARALDQDAIDRRPSTSSATTGQRPNAGERRRRGQRLPAGRLEHAGLAEAEAGRTRPQGSTTAEMPVLAAAHQRQALLDRAHARHGEVLVGPGAAPEPGIVGDVQQPGRAGARGRPRRQERSPRSRSAG